MSRLFARLVILACLVDLVLVVVLLVWAEVRARDGMPADGTKTIIVLYGERWVMGKQTISRLRSAALLATPESRFYCVGGARPDMSYWGSCEMKRWLVATGVDPSRIDTDTTSFDTLTNTRSIHRYLENEGGRPAVVVTDSLHVLRVGGMVHGADVLGLPLLDGSTGGLLFALYRAQLEIVAWGGRLLPEELYLRLLSASRGNRNVQEHQCELTSSGG